MRAKQAHGEAAELGGALLVAPRFTEDGLGEYLAGLAAHARSVFAKLEAFSHREGYVRLGARDGIHVLLVEEVGDKRRALVMTA